MSLDENVLKAYVGMLLDGTAFENWEEQPTAKTRLKLVDGLFLNGKHTPAFKSKIKKVVMEARSEDDLKRIFAEMQIDEDEFLV